MLQSELDLSVVIWLDQGFDPFQDLRRSCSRGFRSFRSFGLLGGVGTFLLHPYSRWMVLHIACILYYSGPWLHSCNMVLLDVEVMCGFGSVGVGLVYGTLPLE